MKTAIQVVVGTFIAAVLVPGVAVAQAKADEPIKTTLCELVKDAARFGGKMVEIRGRVLIAFEEFTLDTTKCDVNTIGDVWLEYGRGPKRQPTTWCCGDMIPQDRLVVVQNPECRRFHNYLTAQYRIKGCYYSECHRYDVTATMTGRFDAAEARTCPDGKSRCCYNEFGHLGFCCGRLVIQSVSDVIAEPIDRSVYEKAQ